MAAIIVLVILIILFIGTYVLNARTKAPFEVEDIKCQSCSNHGCSHNTSHKRGAKRCLEL